MTVNHRKNQATNKYLIKPMNEGQTSGSGNMLQTSKDMTADAKRSCLAQGAKDAFKPLEGHAHYVDTIEVVRRLQLYAGRAIMLCKKLHEFSSEVQPISVSLHKKLSSASLVDFSLGLVGMSIAATV